MATAAHDSLVVAPPQVDRLLCAVDGSDGSAEAVREALVLAPCTAQLGFIAVAGDDFDDRRERQALERAQALARARDIDATTEVVRARDVVATLLERAGDRALLVVGAAGPRPRDGALGPVATALLRQAPGPVLIARAGATSRAPVRRVLAAVADSPHATAVVRAAGRIAATCGGHVELAHVQGRDYGTRTRRHLATLSTELIELTGAEPVVLTGRGTNVAARLAALAATHAANLVVAGHGDRAPGSRPERIAAAAPCSVLLVPTATDQ